VAAGRFTGLLVAGLDFVAATYTLSIVIVPAPGAQGRASPDVEYGE
jgi:hypothetical protein